MILTPYEKQKVAFAQEEAINKMYKWSLSFVALYFVLQIIRSLFNLFVN